LIVTESAADHRILRRERLDVLIVGILVQRDAVAARLVDTSCSAPWAVPVLGRHGDVVIASDVHPACAPAFARAKFHDASLSRPPRNHDGDSFRCIANLAGETGKTLPHA